MRQRLITIERLEAIARAALIGGYGQVETWRDSGVVRRQVKLAISMDCQRPVYAELFSRLPAVHGMKRFPMTIVIEGRCRRCATCKERRRVFWAARARYEWTVSPVTLFGTLTFSPENDAVLDARARLYHARRGVDFDKLPPEELFRERVKFAGQEVTKWLKRLRNSDRKRPLAFRYLLVAEAHSSGKTSELKRGRPHFHCLIHQAPGAQLCEYDDWARKPDGNVRTDKSGNPILSDGSFLKRQWQAGYSTFALCRSPQAASYVCKYLTKEETSVRIRASFRYGASVSESESAMRSEEKIDIPKGEGPTKGE